jgi:hypothetical protein
MARLVVPRLRWFNPPIGKCNALADKLPACYRRPFWRQLIALITVCVSCSIRAAVDPFDRARIYNFLFPSILIAGLSEGSGRDYHRASRRLLSAYI